MGNSTCYYDLVNDLDRQANIYFDGKCVSHSVVFPDGTRKSLGVIFPATLDYVCRYR